MSVQIDNTFPERELSLKIILSVEEIEKLFQ